MLINCWLLDAPSLGSPSVRKRKMFSPSVHGDPYSSRCAALSRSKAFLIPSSKLVPPRALSPLMEEDTHPFTSSVALSILSEDMIQASELKATAPTKSELLRVFTTLQAASLASPIRLPLIEPDTSIIKITFLAPAVADTYHGLNLGS